MASDLNFVEYIVDQIENVGEVSYKKMFGEYALYCDGVIFALICEDQLFIKPSEAGRLYIEDLVEAPPYPGAKLYFLIESQFDNREWISKLVRVSVEELSKVKPKTRRKKKG